MFRRDPESFPLPDREIPESFVRAEHISLSVHDAARTRRCVQQLHVAAAVEILTVRLVLHAQTVCLGELAHLRLMVIPQRKHHPFQLSLFQSVQEIRLVLLFVRAAQQMKHAVFLPDPSVMPRGEPVERDPGFPRQSRQNAELHQGVASHARIGRAPGEVLRAEILQHDRLVLVRAVEHMVLDPELAAQRLRGGDVLRFARPETRVAFAAAVAPLAPELHRDADHRVALFAEHRGRDRGIHAARETDRDDHGRASSIRSIGAFAARHTSSGSSISGAMSRRQNSTSSSVIFFMFGQTTAGSSG